jgi:hypothetical protein
VRNVERLSTATSVAEENLTARATKLVPEKRSPLTPELKEFIDCAIVPALVKAYLAEVGTRNMLASDDVPSDNHAVAFALTEGNKRT